MSPIGKILVATDFSPHAARALEYAVDWAKTLGATIDVVHVYEAPLVELTPYHLAIPLKVLEGVRDAARERLEGLREKVAAEGIATAVHLREGNSAEGVADAARELGADLIVMGTRGNTGLKHVLLGSVAERTLRLAPCPVLTLHAAGA
ncbi:MAG: universal stress protein [Myxococcales bacterium]|nr:universal stress protein [Myxococcales bacterium]